MPDRLQLELGDETIEVRVASPHAILLHLDFARAAAGLPGPSSSIYLGPPAGSPASAEVLPEKNGVVGLRTPSGELLIDKTSRRWELLDANGKVLADWASLGGMAAGSPQVTASIGAAASGSRPLLYGSGNLPNPGALTQTQSGDRMANGKATLPQFWSSAGYGTLMLGRSGDHPATWLQNAAGGVDLTVPGDSLDLYLMPAPTLYDWLRDDAELTGFAPVPPRWTFGYLQSRWGWQDKAYIDDTLAHFRKDKLPVDAFIFDFEWYTTKPDYKVPPQGDPDFVDFGWNPKLFPDPAAQIAGWLKQGLRVVGIRKPRLGNSEALAMARRKGWLLTIDPHDTYGGETAKRNLDFANPDVRQYWDANNRKFLEAGMAGFWNDEGEEAYTEYAYWNLAESDLLQQVRPGDRFWSINRSFSPGMQRYGAAVWTGDIAGDWATLARTPGELLSFSLAGMPYSTCDIGGFYKNPSPELLVRWMQAGVFFPVMRAHSTRGDTPHFPWLFGKEAEDAIRQALDLRYRLIPYYDSLAHETAQTGAPLMRPLAMEFPDDPKAATITDEWLVGSRLLAAPILASGGKREIYLPKDSWYRFGVSGASSGPADVHVFAPLLTGVGAGAQSIPAYVRAGTLLPLGPVIQTTTQVPTAPLQLQIYPGHDASFTLVEDDGATLAYEHGDVRRTRFVWHDGDRRLTWSVDGSYAGNGVYKSMQAVLYSSRSGEGLSGNESVETAPLGKAGSLQF